MRDDTAAQLAVANAWRVDWARLARLVVLVGVGLVGLLTLYANARGNQYGFDYHGIWRAGRDILNGDSPYPAPNPHRLLVTGNPYVLPPLLGVVTIPLSALPLTAAIVPWNLASTVGLIGALALVGVRDWRVYVMAVFSFPFVSSLALGQPDGLLALAAALAWRYRDSWSGALAVAVLIAAKLLFWPLLLWLLFTRRLRCALVALAATTTLLLASWAPIGFHGFAGYGQLLAADAHAFEIRSHSGVALAMRLGASESVAAFVAAALAVAIALAVIRISRGSDYGGFLAAIVAGLLVSPILWSHYLVLLFVPLAIAHRRIDALWLLTAAFWFSPVEPPAASWQVAVVLATACTIALGSSRARSLLT